MKIEQIKPVKSRNTYGAFGDKRIINVVIGNKGEKRKGNLQTIYMGIFLKSIGKNWQYMAAGWANNRLVIWEGEEGDFRISQSGSRGDTTKSVSNTALCHELFSRYGIAIPTAPDTTKRATFEAFALSGSPGYYELKLLSVK